MRAHNTPKDRTAAAAVAGSRKTKVSPARKVLYCVYTPENEASFIPAATRAAIPSCSIEAFEQQSSRVSGGGMHAAAARLTAVACSEAAASPAPSLEMSSGGAGGDTPENTHTHTHIIIIIIIILVVAVSDSECRADQRHETLKQGHACRIKTDTTGHLTTASSCMRMHEGTEEQRPISTHRPNSREACKPQAAKARQSAAPESQPCEWLSFDLQVRPAEPSEALHAKNLSTP